MFNNKRQDYSISEVQTISEAEKNRSFFLLCESSDVIKTDRFAVHEIFFAGTNKMGDTLWQHRSDELIHQPDHVWKMESERRAIQVMIENEIKDMAVPSSDKNFEKGVAYLHFRLYIKNLKTKNIIVPPEHLQSRRPSITKYTTVSMDYVKSIGSSTTGDSHQVNTADSAKENLAEHKNTDSHVVIQNALGPSSTAFTKLEEKPVFLIRAYLDFDGTLTACAGGSSVASQLYASLVTDSSNPLDSVFKSRAEILAILKEGLAKDINKKLQLTRNALKVIELWVATNAEIIIVSNNRKEYIEAMLLHAGLHEDMLHKICIEDRTTPGSKAEIVAKREKQFITKADCVVICDDLSDNVQDMLDSILKTYPVDKVVKRCDQAGQFQWLSILSAIEKIAGRKIFADGLVSNDEPVIELLATREPIWRTLPEPTFEHTLFSLKKEESKSKNTPTMTIKELIKLVPKSFLEATTVNKEPPFSEPVNVPVRSPRNTN